MNQRPPSVHYRLSRASPAIKVLTTGSLVLILGGILTIICYAIVQTGLTPTGLAQHYRGNPQEGPGQLHFALSRQELLRITHVHTLGMGMLLYIYGHMFTLTGLSERAKTLWIGAFFAGLAGFLGSLWLIATVSASFVWLFLVSFSLALAALLVMSVAILWEIWLAIPDAALGSNGAVAPGGR